MLSESAITRFTDPKYASVNIDEEEAASMADRIRQAKQAVQSDSEKRRPKIVVQEPSTSGSKLKQYNYRDDLSDHDNFYTANPKFVAIEPPSPSGFADEHQVKIVANDLSNRFINLIDHANYQEEQT